MTAGTRIAPCGSMRQVLSFQASYVTPDAHWGYGFPIGGVAAFDPDEGAPAGSVSISPAACGRCLPAERFPPFFRSRGALAEAAGELPSMSSMPEALAEHHFLQEFGTNLMAEPARTAVDGHDDVVKRKLERFSVMASKISVTTWTSR
jgi:hypothetical protein